MEKNWISVHVFYSANQDPLVINLVAPLVDDLRANGLIQRYFFIKYWMEGPHIRLRLLPTEGVTEAEVKAFVEPRIEAYLSHLPALFEVDRRDYKAFHKEMFIKEYGVEAWNEKYGPDGEMPIRNNNTYAYIDYEPEYHRYGGEEGVDLAEWHFEKSSDVVIRLLKETNARVRSILLGLSAQLTLPLCYGFMPDEEVLIDFFGDYMKYWTEVFNPSAVQLHPEYEKRFLHLAPELDRRISDIRGYVTASTPGKLTPVEQEWLAHVRELRRRIDALIRDEKLHYARVRGGEKAPITTEDIAHYKILLSSYIHMTNNRLGVSISDEIYLSYLIKRALEERRRVMEAAA